MPSDKALNRTSPNKIAVVHMPEEIEKAYISETIDYVETDE